MPPAPTRTARAAALYARRCSLPVWSQTEHCTYVIARDQANDIQYRTVSGEGEWDAGCTTLPLGHGAFTSQPSAISWSPDRLNMFAVGPAPKDDVLAVGLKPNSAAWTLANGAAQLKSLGGSFESVPSAIVTLPPSSSSFSIVNNTAVRIDVVALGTDDLIEHRVLSGSKWGNDWEDLAVWAIARHLSFSLTAPRASWWSEQIMSSTIRHGQQPLLSLGGD
ncbi:hypothetical protein QBC46DRAFT_442122 [Diplogelasinospora grovesii]|uniref:Uncharacterized protein n=1 Tax=Diplogelasinospora grovesii TaxID=303347 RepID=A0AAN6S8G7_9PEZI|nr:hypothetical protein QBC46DRAFT_442122 [Diplogelasinospora grovesii]